MTKLYRTVTFAAAACALSLLVAASARAQGGVDPATLHTGSGAGTACATGCGGDPNVFFGNTFDIYQNASGGPANLSQPLLLILGIPNVTGNNAAYTPSSVTFYNPYTGYPSGATPGSAAAATGGEFGLLNSPVSGDYFGNFTAAAKDVYSFLGLGGSGVDKSNNWVNWTGAESSILGITATGFGIYVFDLTGAALGAGGLADIMAAIPTGTFVIGYGQNSDGTPYVNPFTEAGLDGGMTVTPEPGSMALLGTGLLALGGALRRRLKKQA
jgi:PEP-CTERM motif